MYLHHQRIGPFKYKCVNITQIFMSSILSRIYSRSACSGYDLDPAKWCRYRIGRQNTGLKIVLSLYTRMVRRWGGGTAFYAWEFTIKFPSDPRNVNLHVLINVWNELYLCRLSDNSARNSTSIFNAGNLFLAWHGSRLLFVIISVRLIVNHVSGYQFIAYPIFLCRISSFPRAKF